METVKKRALAVEALTVKTGKKSGELVEVKIHTSYQGFQKVFREFI